eukprot:TRINITY_DN1221_c0_g1_i1.p1 TRINITY_DN1221_c0_g1~~TRINITY_DN1221_c0_g1_i1.p1  ORF type:complete len:139 (+),score=27.94 TRINITY_DN1221_c0_g1_i1:35-451(+)
MITAARYCRMILVLPIVLPNTSATYRCKILAQDTDWCMMLVVLLLWADSVLLHPAAAAWLFFIFCACRLIGHIARSFLSLFAPFRSSFDSRGSPALLVLLLLLLLLLLPRVRLIPTALCQRLCANGYLPAVISPRTLR